MKKISLLGLIVFFSLSSLFAQQSYQDCLKSEREKVQKEGASFSEALEYAKAICSQEQQNNNANSSSGFLSSLNLQDRKLFFSLILSPITSVEYSRGAVAPVSNNSTGDTIYIYSSYRESESFERSGTGMGLKIGYYLGEKMRAYLMNANFSGNNYTILGVDGILNNWIVGAGFGSAKTVSYYCSYRNNDNCYGSASTFNLGYTSKVNDMPFSYSILFSSLQFSYDTDDWVVGELIRSDGYNTYYQDYYKNLEPSINVSAIVLELNYLF